MPPTKKQKPFYTFAPPLPPPSSSSSLPEMSNEVEKEIFCGVVYVMLMHTNASQLNNKIIIIIFKFYRLLGETFFFCWLHIVFGVCTFLKYSFQLNIELHLYFLYNVCLHMAVWQPTHKIKWMLNYQKVPILSKYNGLM